MPETIDIHVGRRIEARRRELRISASDLARALRIGRQRLRDIERGTRRTRPHELAEIAGLLMVPIFYFFDGYGAQKERKGEEDMRGRSLVLATCVLAAAGSSPRAEPNELTLLRLRSIGFLPLMVMQEEKLVEKHAREQGLGDLKVSYATAGSGAAANDALLSNTVQFAAAGVAPFLVLWDRTRGSTEVRALSALNSTPAYLVTRNPKVRSVADFGDSDRINVTAPKVSVQAVLLEIAAAKAFGVSQYSKLDRLTVGMAAADGSAALISGAGDLTADFSLPPFAYRELATAGVHLVLRSDDLLGGPATNSILYTTRAFYDANPRSVAAVVAALNEAIALICRDRIWASELYMRAEGRSPEVSRMIADPTITFEREPHNLLTYANFMHSFGTIKHVPANLHDLFFEREAAAIQVGD